MSSFAEVATEAVVDHMEDVVEAVVVAATAAVTSSTETAAVVGAAGSSMIQNVMEPMKQFISILLLSNSNQHDILKMVQTLAPISSFLLYLSPLLTMITLTRQQSIGTLPLLPYTFMLVNNIVWLSYGYMKQEKVILLANGVGTILSIGYFIQFIRIGGCSTTTTTTTISQEIITKPVQKIWLLLVKTLLGSKSVKAGTKTSTSTTTKKVFQLTTGMKQQIIFVTFIAILIGFIISGVVPKTLLSSDPTPLLGKAGMLFTMSMFASPLTVLKQVIQQQSAISIPLPVTIASLFNNYCWGIVGSQLMKDTNVYYPAMIGFFFATIQLLLKMKYGNGNRYNDKASPLLLSSNTVPARFTTRSKMTNVNTKRM